jgi:uncharacterized protein (TIGR03546 family)
MIALKILLNFLKALSSRASPRAIAGGFALGAVIGFTPVGSLHNVVVLLLIFILPVNKSASLVSAALFALVSFPLDPLFDRIGYFLLTRDALRGLWTAMYNTPVLPWTRFNNTVTLGSLAVSAVLFFPLFLGAAWGVKTYRTRVVAWAGRWRLMQILKASKLYGIYESLT